MIAPNLLDEKPLDLAAPNETDPSWACTLKSALQMLAQRRPLCLQKQTSQKRESIFGPFVRASAERAAAARKEADRLACRITEAT